MVTTQYLNDRVSYFYNQNLCGKLVLEELSRTKVSCVGHMSHRLGTTKSVLG